MEARIISNQPDWNMKHVPNVSRATKKLKKLLDPYLDHVKQSYELDQNNNIYVDPIVNKRTIYGPANFSVPGRYEIMQVLGKGSYGTVVSALDKANHEREVKLAIKKVTSIFTREILLKRAIRELKFMSYFKGHRNIVSLLDLEIVNEEPYSGLYCYQELVDYDLARVIHSNVLFSEFHIKHFLYQILCGLKYIHSADVIHRDLKPGNILCSITGEVKICDFGLARGISPSFTVTGGISNHITNYVATRWYRAPELILSHKRYSKSVDMWAVGCILAEFYGRKPIFMGNDSLHQVMEIQKVLGTPSQSVIRTYGSSRCYDIFSTSKPQFKKTPWCEIFPYASQGSVDLMERLIDWCPDSRLTVEEALNHPFVQEVRNPAAEPICPYGPFDFTYEKQLYSMDRLRECLCQEVSKFHNDRQTKDFVSPPLMTPQFISESSSY